MHPLRFFLTTLLTLTFVSLAYAAPDPCKYRITSPTIFWTMTQATGELKGTRSGAYINLLDSEGNKVAKADGSVNFTEQQAAMTLMLQKMLQGCRPAVVGGGGGTTTPPPAADTASVTFNWSAPTTRENGSALAPAELSGFVLYVTDMGSRNFTFSAAGTARSQTVQIPRPGTYYAAIAAVDTQQRSSAQSTPPLQFTLP